MVNFMCQLHWAKGCPYSCWASQVAQVVKNPPATAGDVGSIPGSGRSPGGENGNSLQYSYLENSTDRGAWRATVHGGHKESDTTEPPSMQTHTHSHWKAIWSLLSGKFSRHVWDLKRRPSQGTLCFQAPWQVIESINKQAQVGSPGCPPKSAGLWDKRWRRTGLLPHWHVFPPREKRVKI